MIARDLTGLRFNKLTALRYVGSVNKRRIWECRCECGNLKTISAGDLNGGRLVSCGCHRDSIVVKRNRDTALHNMTGSRTYISWFNMRQRVMYKNDKCYKNYGGAGVTICERWSDFRNFLADMGERPEGKTLDRVNPYGNYEPANCRWATPKEQAANKRAKHVHCG